MVRFLFRSRLKAQIRRLLLWVGGMRTAAQFCVRLFSLLDVLLVAAALAFTWTLHFRQSFPDFLFVLMIVPFWRWFYAFFGLYQSHRLESLISGATSGELRRPVFGLRTRPALPRP